MDINKFTEKAREAVTQAQSIAVGMGHQDIDSEHLALALIRQEQGIVPRILDQMGVQTAALAVAVEEKLRKRPSVSGGGMYAGYVPAASVFESLCMFTDGTQQVQIIDEMGGLDFFNEVMADSNFVAVGWMSGGSRNVLSTVPVRTADDFKGLNIRVPDNQVYVDIFKTLGCNPTIVSWSEGYTAMQTGMVSAIEAGTETLATANLQEVADYYTITGHINVTNFCSMNKDKWNSLSENQQNAVIEAMKLANELQLSLSEENEQVYHDKFVEAGIEIIELSSDDIAKLQESVSGIVTSTAESYGFADKVAELRSCLG